MFQCSEDFKMTCTWLKFLVSFQGNKKLQVVMEGSKQTDHL